MSASRLTEHTYHPVALGNFESLPMVRKLPPEIVKAVRVVGSVLPFKSNRYVTDKLIDWKNYADDPMFILTFPQKDMIPAAHYNAVERLLDINAAPEKIKEEVERIRRALNPHPSGQLNHNRPLHHGVKLPGMQHKYRETVLFFPKQGQTCHAYCTFCFRWAQFVGLEDLRFASREAGLLADYVREHPCVSDVLITGGDPMIMKAKFLATYVKELLSIKTLRTIRIGSKALAYWPRRFTTDPDAKDLLDVFRKVVDSGKHLAFMAHFNHFTELSTPEIVEAARAIRSTGAMIRTQSPLIKNINDSSDVWSKMWQKQVEMGMIPYYMFVARDTGAHRCFGVPLARAREIFRGAHFTISGLARTARGPIMSATPGKVRVLGPSKIRGEKVLTLNFFQARNPKWVGRPFFAKYDPEALWLNDLKPAFGHKEFFFEAELAAILKEESHWRPATAEKPGTGAPRTP